MIVRYVFFIVCLLFVIFFTFQNSGSEAQDEVINSNTLDNVITNKTGTFSSVYFQDSLRGALLERKTNDNLKSSVLQELYIRGLAKEVDQMITFFLPFDLHSFDCGAPDCYSTDITFKIPLSNPISFPSQIQFKLREHGCGIDEEIIIEDVFDLMEESTEYVNYYSDNIKGSLVILGTKRGLYFFPNVTPGGIAVNEIEKLLESLEESMKMTNQIPYQSTIMIKKEYDSFF